VSSQDPNGPITSADYGQLKTPSISSVESFGKHCRDPSIGSTTLYIPMPCYALYNTPIYVRVIVLFDKYLTIWGDDYK